MYADQTSSPGTKPTALTVAMSGDGTASLGLIGLGAIGRDLALRLSRAGIEIVAWDSSPAVRGGLAGRAESHFDLTQSLDELVRCVKRPRLIMVAIPADAVSHLLSDLAPLLATQDLVLDMGNSWYRDTMRHGSSLQRSGLGFLGVGLSGGVTGRRHGYSLMAGGDAAAFKRAESVLQALAARTDDGLCLTHVGSDGSGHFVKMIHNGIEYGAMQLIAESYDLLQHAYGFDSPRVAEVFRRWNEGPLQSFLLELTAHILTVPDPNANGLLVEQILDEAEQKGTGKWTVRASLEYGVATPSISAAVDARMISAHGAERSAAAEEYGPRHAVDSHDGLGDLDSLQDALRVAMICTHAQGFALMQAASEREEWDIDLGKVARIWRGGCIIRSRLLDDVVNAYDGARPYRNLLLFAGLRRVVALNEAGLRKTVALASRSGIPLPSLSASLAYLDAYRRTRLPQHLVQAQRDAFGAHGYVRRTSPHVTETYEGWLPPDHQ